MKNEKDQGVNCQGLFGFHPNSTVEFNGLGVKVRVSLRIPSDLVPYMSRNNIFRSSGGGYSYALSYQLEDKINEQRVRHVQKVLLSRVMYWVRQAKCDKLEKEKSLLRKECFLGHDELGPSIQSKQLEIKFSINNG